MHGSYGNGINGIFMVKITTNLATPMALWTTHCLRFIRKMRELILRVLTVTNVDETLIKRGTEWGQWHKDSKKRYEIPMVYIMIVVVNLVYFNGVLWDSWDFHGLVTRWWLNMANWASTIYRWFSHDKSSMLLGMFIAMLHRQRVYVWSFA